jgi:Phage portal protein, lambda family
MTDKPYKINDRRGIDKSAASLYPSPRNNIRNYRPRYYFPSDTYKSNTPSDRYDQTRYGRELFASSATLGSAILAKNKWAIGHGWQPSFTGKNSKWGDEAEQWLREQWFPRCNVLGPNYDFRTTLYLTGVAIDVDGDSMMVFTYNRDGFPQIQLIPSHRIGQRDFGNVVKEGKYAGYPIYDGVVCNFNNYPIAYSVLGDNKDEDIFIPINKQQFLFEPEWGDQYRGISRVARPLFDILDLQDTDELEKRAIKLAAAIGIIHSTESGQADASTPLIGAEEDIISGIVQPNAPPVEQLYGGEIYYTKAGVGEDIKAFLSDRPSPNTQAFVERVQRGVMAAVGWPYELLNPSKIGGASVRLIQDIARQSIADRQQTLERRARAMVAYALSVAMEEGFISKNNDPDVFNWKFTKPAKLSVDNGNEASADRDGYKLGTNTLAEISSKKGEDWFELRNQTEIEVDDLLTRAQKLASKFNITLDNALNLLSQRSANSTPVLPPIDAKSLDDQNN